MILNNNFIYFETRKLDVISEASLEFVFRMLRTNKIHPINPLRHQIFSRLLINEKPVCVRKCENYIHR